MSAVAEGIFNAYNAAALIPRSEPIFVTSARGFGWQHVTESRMGVDPSKVFRHFSLVAAAHPEVPEWATISRMGGGPWFPAKWIPRMEELTWANDFDGHKIGSHLKCYVGTPCEAIVHGPARSTSSWICGRPAVPGELIRVFSDDVPGCKIHVNGRNRSAANDARWREEWASRDKARKDERDLTHASAEWAARFRDELGIDARPNAPHGQHLVVAVNPEKLYKDLIDLLGILRDVGIEDHPFQSEGDAGA